MREEPIAVVVQRNVVARGGAEASNVAVLVAGGGALWQRPGHLRRDEREMARDDEQREAHRVCQASLRSNRVSADRSFARENVRRAELRFVIRMRLFKEGIFHRSLASSLYTRTPHTHTRTRWSDPEVVLHLRLLYHPRLHHLLQLHLRPRRQINR